MGKSCLLIFSLFVLAFSNLHGQNTVISGKVLDFYGNPVSGASITIKGTTKGTVADTKGNFTISASPDDIIMISSTGFGSMEVPVNGRQSITVTLDPSATELQQIVLVGTRSAGRAKTETPVPVDVINVSSPQPTSRLDLTSLLNFTAPSFNYNKQSGSDGADHVDLATLRGLGPDQTLVLVNGKRRHQTSFVSVFGTRGRGNSGTDLNSIPLSAIDRVEILRDGASAQYGSDAIAGVINIILKKSVNKLTGNLGVAAFNDPKFNTAFKNGMSNNYVYNHKLDGRAITAGLNYGIPVGKQAGFINLSADYLANGKTYRQVLDTSDPVNNKDALPINVYRRANGDASLQSIATMINAELPISMSTTFYTFGGYSFRNADAYAFTRNFSLKPERFPTNADGTIIDYPGIIQTASDGEKYFNPHIQTKIGDFSWASGVRGSSVKGWNWDFSNNLGYNRFHFYGDKTFNASLGAGKTHFDDGGFSFLQNTTNLNLSREYAGVREGLNLAFGAEFRYERYTIFAGEEDSYKNYSNGSKATGAQGFPGYQVSDEVKADRNNIAGYIDAELDVTKRFLLSGAVRLENYSDFGFSHNYKLATRIKAADRFNIRGSISTGFRAPSLQQINFSSTFTTVQGGTIAEVKIAPNYNSITKAAGIPKLRQERSVNGSLGFAYNPIPSLSITVDGYWVRIKDRVVLSGQFSSTASGIDPVLANEMDRLNVEIAQFFANAVNTTNKGIDVVLEYNRRFTNNRVKILFAGNVQDMSIDKVNIPGKLSGSQELRQTFLSDREKAFILASAPPSKFALNLEYGYKRFSVGTRLNYFGKVVILGYGEDGLGIDPKVPTDANETIKVKDQYNYNGKLVSDLYATYSLNSHFTLQLGADNIFNVHPDLGVAEGARLWAYNNEPAGPFDAVQMGSNGRRLFTRLAFSF